MLRDKKGRFSKSLEKTGLALLYSVSMKMEQRQKLLEKAEDLRRECVALVEKEKDRPAWLVDTITLLAAIYYVQPGQVSDKVKITHPTPSDPVLLIDGKAVMSWV
jgi:hypothetical protein